MLVAIARALISISTALLFVILSPWESMKAKFWDYCNAALAHATVWVLQGFSKAFANRPLEGTVARLLASALGHLNLTRCASETKLAQEIRQIREEHDQLSKELQNTKKMLAEVENQKAELEKSERAQASHLLETKTRLAEAESLCDLLDKKTDSQAAQISKLAKGSTTKNETIKQQACAVEKLTEKSNCKSVQLAQATLDISLLQSNIEMIQAKIVELKKRLINTTVITTAHRLTAEEATDQLKIVEAKNKILRTKRNCSTSHNEQTTKRPRLSHSFSSKEPSLTTANTSVDSSHAVNSLNRAAKPKEDPSEESQSETAPTPQIKNLARLPTNKRKRDDDTFSSEDSAKHKKIAANPNEIADLSNEPSDSSSSDSNPSPHDQPPKKILCPSIDLTNVASSNDESSASDPPGLNPPSKVGTNNDEVMVTTHGNSVNNDGNVGSNTDRESGTADIPQPASQNPPQVIQLRQHRHNDRDNLEVDLNHVPHTPDILPPLSDHPFTPTPTLSAAIKRLRKDKEMLKESTRIHTHVIRALRNISLEERTLRKEVEAIILALRPLWFQTWKKRGT